MNTPSLELSDPDHDAVTIHHDGAGVWVTCTSETEEVTVGPLPLEALYDWLSATRAA